MSDAMNCVRRLLPADSELADLHRQGVRAILTRLPDVCVGGIALAFCDRWLALAEAEHPARPLVEEVARELRQLGDYEEGGGEEEADAGEPPAGGNDPADPGSGEAKRLRSLAYRLHAADGAELPPWRLGWWQRPTAPRPLRQMRFTRPLVRPRTGRARRLVVRGARLRIRSGSRGDPPSRSNDDDDPDPARRVLARLELHSARAA
jgi:hypothetical protein